MNYIRITVADISDCGINLMYLPFEPSAQMPKFREGAKHPAIEDNGFVLYYTDQCPYTYYWVPRVQEVAKELGAFRRKADYTYETAIGRPFVNFTPDGLTMCIARCIISIIHNASYKTEVCVCPQKQKSQKK